jgi:hypothetical protein
MKQLQRSTLWLTVFAIAMAHVEASLVIHLRSIYYPDNPLAIFPLVVLSQQDLVIELVRELATVVVILGVALVAARGATRVFAAFVYIFGVWDVFYYVWLKIMIGWPQSWLEWDVLFLIPWAWFGPWIAAVLIALLFVIWGGTLLLARPDARFKPLTVSWFTLGSLLALTAFLMPAVPLLPGGTEAFRGFQPTEFLWSLFFAGYLIMAASLGYVVGRG